MTDLHPLLDQQIPAQIEQIVSKYKWDGWVVKEFRDMNEFSSHPSVILSNGLYPVFVKLSRAANGLEQFRLEVEGLRLLSELAGVLTPTPIANIGVVILILEGVKAVERTPKEWQVIGRTLAQIHPIKGQQFDLDTHNYFGSLYQDNRTLNDWPTFYADRYLWPSFMGAINAGNLPTNVIRMVETVIHNLPDLCGPEIAPTVLHGDAQQNNFFSTGQGAFVIDPAVYYGHPEMDLAYIDYFQPVPDDVLGAYREILPIDSGFQARQDLWHIYGYLAAVEVEGAGYLPQLMEALRKYL